MTAPFTLQETVSVAVLCQRLSEQGGVPVTAHTALLQKRVHVFVKDVSIAALLSALISLYGWRLVRRGPGYHLDLPIAPKPAVPTAESLLATVPRELQTLISRERPAAPAARPSLYDDPRLSPKNTVRPAEAI